MSSRKSLPFLTPPPGAAFLWILLLNYVHNSARIRGGTASRIQHSQGRSRCGSSFASRYPITELLFGVEHKAYPYNFRLFSYFGALSVCVSLPLPGGSGLCAPLEVTLFLLPPGDLLGSFPAPLRLYFR